MGFLGLGLIGGLLAAGKKPVVPDFKAVDPNAEQKAAIAGNMANSGRLMDLAGGVNSFNQGQINDIIKKNAPQFFDMRSQQAQNISNDMAGNLSADETAQLQNKNAARALQGGFSGARSGMFANLKMREFGRATFDRSQQGLQEANAWLDQSQALLPKQFDFNQFLMSGAQRSAVTQANNEGQMGRDWLENRISAMPDPTKAAIGNYMIQADDQMSGIIIDVAAGYLTGQDPHSRDFKSKPLNQTNPYTGVGNQWQPQNYPMNDQTGGHDFNHGYPGYQGPADYQDQTPGGYNQQPQNQTAPGSWNNNPYINPNATNAPMWS